MEQTEFTGGQVRAVLGMVAAAIQRLSKMAFDRFFMCLLVNMCLLLYECVFVSKSKSVFLLPVMLKELTKNSIKTLELFFSRNRDSDLPRC